MYIKCLIALIDLRAHFSIAFLFVIMEKHTYDVIVMHTHLHVLPHDLWRTQVEIHTGNAVG